MNSTKKIVVLLSTIIAFANTNINSKIATPTSKDFVFTAERTASGSLSALIEAMIDKKFVKDKEAEANKTVVEKIKGDINTNLKRLKDLGKIVVDSITDVLTKEERHTNYFEELPLNMGKNLIPALTTTLVKNAVNGSDIADAKSYIITIVKTVIGKTGFHTKDNSPFTHDLVYDPKKDKLVASTNPKLKMWENIGIISGFFDMKVVTDHKNAVKYINVAQGIEELIKEVVNIYIEELVDIIISKPEGIDTASKKAKAILNKITGKVITKIIMEVLSPVIKKVCDDVAKNITKELAAYRNKLNTVQQETDVVVEQEQTEVQATPAVA